MGRHGKSPAGPHSRKVHGASRLQAGGDGGIRSHPLPAHSHALRSPPAGDGRAPRGWRGNPKPSPAVTDSPSPAIPCTSACPPSPDLRVVGSPGARRSALHLAPAPRITCIVPRIPHHLHPSPHPAPHAASLCSRPPPRYISRRPREARRADPRARARPPRALRHGGPGPARSRTHLAGSARLRCAPSAPGAEKEPPPEGRREP